MKIEFKSLDEFAKVRFTRLIEKAKKDMLSPTEKIELRFVLEDHKDIPTKTKESIQ